VTASMSETFKRETTPPEMAKKLALRLSRKLGTLYPLRGKVIGVDPSAGVTLNIGTRQGVRRGQCFKVLDQAWELVVESVSPEQSLAVIRKGGGRLEPGPSPGRGLQGGPRLINRGGLERMRLLWAMRFKNASMNIMMGDRAQGHLQDDHLTPRVVAPRRAMVQGPGTNARAVKPPESISESKKKPTFPDNRWAGCKKSTSLPVSWNNAVRCGPPEETMRPIFFMLQAGIWLGVSLKEAFCLGLYLGRLLLGGRA